MQLTYTLYKKLILYKKVKFIITDTINMKNPNIFFKNHSLFLIKTLLFKITMRVDRTKFQNNPHIALIKNFNG